MGTPKEPRPAKYFVGLLSPNPALLDQVETDLTPVFGAVESRSETRPWLESQFYEREMGGGLLRRFIAFASVHSPGRLAEFKRRTQAIEERHRDGASAGRRVNIDPGYLDAFKLVLASTKNASQRIYLDGGIFGEATLLYYNGGFHGLPYTYRDYLWPETLQFLTSVRASYLAQLRARRQSE